MSNLSDPTQFKEQLKKFIVDNNIIGTAAGVSIALVTKDIIQSLVGDIIIPMVFLALMTLNISSFTKILPGKTVIDYSNFAKHFVSWALVIVITFLFVKIAFKMLLGVDDTDKASSDKPEDKKEPFFGGNY
jgi:large-conductance mechanosensitive channel